MWKVVFTKNAEKDKHLLKEAQLDGKAKKILDILAKNPFQIPPSYEKLSGHLNGYYSRRINIHHRIVYRVIKETNTVIVHAMWTHYQSI